MRSQPAQELAAGLRIVHVEHDVRAVVRLGPVAQHRRLDVVELDGDGAARKVAAEAIDECMALSSGLSGSRDSLEARPQTVPVALVADLVQELVDRLADALRAAASPPPSDPGCRRTSPRP